MLTEKLDVGDYGARFENGYIPPVFFDRKSTSDLFGTMGTGYKRFKKCIVRSQEAKVKLFVIVEGTLTDVLKGTKYSTINGATMVYTLFTLWVKHDVQTIFCKDREEMSKYITQYFIAMGKHYIGGLKT